MLTLQHMSGWTRNCFGQPWVRFLRHGHVAFVLNEGGRGITFTVFRNPFGLRLYLAGYVWCSRAWRC